MGEYILIVVIKSPFQTQPYFTPLGVADPSLGVSFPQLITTLSEIPSSGERATKTAHAPAQEPGFKEEGRRKEEERGTAEAAKGEGKGEEDRDSPNGGGDHG